VAYGGGGKIARGVARKAFTLAELAVTCSLMAILCGCINLAASSVIAGFSDQTSDRAVEREAREAVAWIKSHLHRARMLRGDITLFVPGDGICASYIRFSGPGKESYHLHGESIGFKVPYRSEGGYTINFFVYSYIHQTMTPAFRLGIWRKTEGGYVPVGLNIYATGRGYVYLKKE
jgi:hypothetical protein